MSRQSNLADFLTLTLSLLTSGLICANNLFRRSTSFRILGARLLNNIYVECMNILLVPILLRGSAFEVSWIALRYLWQFSSKRYMPVSVRSNFISLQHFSDSLRRDTISSSLSSEILSYKTRKPSGLDLYSLRIILIAWRASYCYSSYHEVVNTEGAA
jgi:hypothetical protein